MDLPSKLLSCYLSLVENGVPASLNIWTEEGNEGKHHFRLSSSVSRNKTPMSKMSFSPEFYSKQSDIPLPNIRTPPPRDRPPPVNFKKVNLSSPPPTLLPETPTLSVLMNSTANGRSLCDTFEPSNTHQHSNIPTRNRFSVLQDLNTDENDSKLIPTDGPADVRTSVDEQDNVPKIDVLTKVVRKKTGSPCHQCNGPMESISPKEPDYMHQCKAYGNKNRFAYLQCAGPCREMFCGMCRQLQC
jgi:hypothetical protein